MYKSLEEICEMTTKEGKPFWKIVQEDDCREQGISEGKAFEQMRGMYQAMREADDNYDGKLKSASGLVGTDGEKMHAAREAGTLLCGKFIGKVMEKALKTGESNACMKRIVAAPTHAAALALKNLLGLACDPVAGLVEVPCVKRNVMGAVNAMTSSDMVMAGITSKIPPDEVIDAMRAIGRSMSEDIRETGKGGLAGTPTGVAIRERMAGTL